MTLSQNTHPHNINVLTDSERRLRLQKAVEAMTASGIDCAIISTNVNIFYLTGRIFSGYIYLSCDGSEPVYFVKRPVDISGERVVRIHKPENMPEELTKMGIIPGKHLGLELNRLPYTMACRIASAMHTELRHNVDTAIDAARSVKTPAEIEEIRLSGQKLAGVYSRIPTLYHAGMSDVELQIGIEQLLRLQGCLGQFRIAGDDMDIFMGNVLAGDNADAPSPFDFAMGGAGISPSLPVGANGTLLHEGMSVMVDMNGNFAGHMADMTRCFSIGDLDERALEAHRLSIDICNELQRMACPGAEARALYEKAADMAKEAGLHEYFMGHRQHAGFVGHGVGIEVNELPVLAPRSRAVLAPGNVIAIEPKFVIPGTGAVGIENTYAVREEGPADCLTEGPEEIVKLLD